jgi:hypothetical protein
MQCCYQGGTITPRVAVWVGGLLVLTCGAFAGHMLMLFG